MAYKGRNRNCITLNKSSQQKAEYEIATKEGFCFGEALESVYPLLDIIFDYLDNKDIKSVALVKKSWQAIAERVLNKRNHIGWLTTYRYKRENHLVHSSSYWYNNSQFGIIIFNYSAVSLNDQFCYHDSNPICASRKTKLSEILNQHIVPHGIPYCVISCPLIASYFSKSTCDLSKRVPLFEACFLPPIPNITINMFYFDNNQSEDILQNQKLKALLLFCKPGIDKHLDKHIRKLGLTSAGNFALGGGVIQSTAIFPTSTREQFKSRRHFCIAFSENKDCNSVFNAYSIVIQREYSDNYFENELIKFKNIITIREHSIAFRACCSAKSPKNYERMVFKKVFPDTILFGMNVGGEIGWNYFNTCDKYGAGVVDDELSSENSNTCEDIDFEYNIIHPRKKFKDDSDELPPSYHQWSTVIVFITWGDIIKNQ